jgi:hypothetical protein
MPEGVLVTQVMHTALSIDVHASLRNGTQIMIENITTACWCRMLMTWTACRLESSLLRYRVEWPARALSGRIK